MIQAIAVDDEPLALDIIKAYSEQIPNLQLVKSFSKVTDAAKYLSRFPVDLVFLDINMPQQSGVEFAKTLNPETMIIFTTAYSEYAVQAFDINAIDYLLKPIAFDRFAKAVEKASQMAIAKMNSNQEAQFLYVRSDYNLVQVPLNEILLIESFADYIDIAYGNKRVTTRMPLKNIIEKLPQKDFIRVHRSFIIPINKIDKFNKRVIHIGPHEVPIGNSYEEEFFKRMGRQ